MVAAAAARDNQYKAILIPRPSIMHAWAPEARQFQPHDPLAA